MANLPATDLTVDDPHAHGHGGDGGGHYDENGELMLVGHDGELHPARLQHFFVSAEQQFEASKLGMWLFLATEILLFGGMFVAYGIFRAQYPDLFEEASQQLDTVLGATNTLVLLLSSFTMAWAIRAIQLDDVKRCVQMLLATVLLASGFLVVKYFEYTHKFELGIYPGVHFQLDEGTPTVGDLAAGTAVLAAEPETVAAAGFETPANGVGGIVDGSAAQPLNAEHALEDGVLAADGEHAADSHGGAHGREGAIFSNRRAGIFFSIYYVMTGIHAFHIVIGIIAISMLAWKAHRRRYSSVWYTPVENVGLYWHIVDIIWIFVFPLMYLI